MKPIEELGISPAPWTTCAPTKREVSVVFLKNDKWHSVQDVALCRSDRRNSDARLIASAPKLYEALYEDVKFYCDQCLEVNGLTECPKSAVGHCKVREWRNLLEQISGEREEVSNG